MDIGTLLVQKSLINQAQFREARDVQMQKGGDMGRICVDMGFVDDKRVATMLSQALAVPKVDLAKVTGDAEALAEIPRALAATLCAFPCVLRDGGRTLWVAMANPSDDNGKLALQRAAGCDVKVTVAGYREIEAAIEASYAWDDAGGLELDGDSGLDGPIKITDMSGKTMVTMAPTRPEAPKPSAAPPPAPVRRDAAPAARAVPTPAANPDTFGPEERKMLAMLQEGVEKSTGALQAALQLCIERGLFTRDEVVERLRR